MPGIGQFGEGCTAGQFQIVRVGSYGQHPSGLQGHTVVNPEGGRDKKAHNQPRSCEQDYNLKPRAVRRLHCASHQ
ncbi:hypothetical protein NtRootA1_06920 [Arthrobacter sp. NtRootA1]|nr:hypothetical protein NtRootA1_06920 [Arthrobacter sp. NtRootA1]